MVDMPHFNEVPFGTPRDEVLNSWTVQLKELGKNSKVSQLELVMTGIDWQIQRPVMMISSRDCGYFSIYDSYNDRNIMVCSKQLW